MRRRVRRAAATHDQLAGTYDLLAQSRPYDAARLHACAARARDNALAERDLADRYRTSPP